MRIWRHLFSFLLSLSILAFVLGHLGVLDWRLELLSHFRPYTMLGIVLGCAGLLVTADRRLAVYAGGVGILMAALMLGSVVLPLGPVSAAPAAGIGVLSYNVLHWNDTPDATLDVIRAVGADVVALAEVGPDLHARLDGLKDLYPRQSFGRPGRSGAVGLLTRLPVLSLREATLSSDGRVALIARLQASFGPVWVVAVHPQAPTGTKENAAWRNEYLANLAALVAALDGPKIVAGDFNTTAFSPYFLRFTEAAGVGGATPWWTTTFPAWMPQGLGIAIDHVLVSGGLEKTTIGTLGAGGSDHRPVHTRVRVRLPFGALASDEIMIEKGDSLRHEDRLVFHPAVSIRRGHPSRRSDLGARHRVQSCRDV